MTPLSLEGQVALVTGASRGVGRGVATALGRAGAIVYATGRAIDRSTFDAPVARIVCDHTDDAQVAAVFERIEREQGQLDVLVNNAWSGYERMVDCGRFTWIDPFWQQPAWRWDAMMTAGVRAAFVASQHAARVMIPHRHGLIVNISQWAAQKYLRNVIYGISKAATDKLTADAAHELRAHNIAIVSLYPGLVSTEAVVAAGVFDLSKAESPEFIGRAVTSLAADPDAMQWTGHVVVAAALARYYGFTDTNGRLPEVLTLHDV